MTETPNTRGISGFTISPIVFTLRNGVIEPGTKGTLTLSGGTGGCFHKEDGPDGSSHWVRTGDATVTGGSFPFTLSGHEVGNNEVQLLFHQDAHYTINYSGSADCKLLADALNAWGAHSLNGLNTEGITLPIGVKYVLIDETSTEYDDATDTTYIDTTHFAMKLLYPKS